MAEVAVSFLLNRLSHLVEEEVKLLGGVQNEVAYITNELQSIGAFLRDADSREETEERVKAWVKQVRDVAYDMEDLLDEFMFCLARKEQRHELCYFLFKSFHFVETLKAQHRFANQMQQIKERVRDISDRSQRYGFRSQEQGSSSSSLADRWHDLRGDALLLEEADLVGIEKPKEKIIGWLLKNSLMLRVVAVVGMGGSGKTTLVKRVYDDQRVKTHFESHVWITVSQSFKTDEVLRDMIEQLFEECNQSIPGGVEAMKETRLKLILKEFLKQRRYVLVFDDIWSNQAWESVKYACPDGKHGSRIIITTRSDDIASSCIKPYGHLYHLKPLSPEESWTLFCEKAFGSKNEPDLTHQLQGLSRSIMRRCEGLPLAIVAIGGLLSTKLKNVIEWQMVYRNLGIELESNDKLRSMKKILSLSYDDLPYHLKSCILYLGVFPEDELIEPMRLIRLWMAEGFIQGDEQGRTMEEIGEVYFYDLINRNLIQILNRHTDGRVRTCRIHSVMKEIVLSKAREENFGEIVVVDELNTQLYDKVRRLSIHNGCEKILEKKSFARLHSLFMFQANIPSISFSCAHFSGFRLLKVLELRDAPLEVFPAEVVNLFHLRYLSLRGTKVKRIPVSIGNLENLQTLDLRYAPVSKLPIGILKLQKLRHLLVHQYNSKAYIKFHHPGFRAPRGIENLETLQSLCFIEANQGSHMIKELGRLRQLRRLGILKIRRENGIDLCSSLEKITNLRSLFLTAAEEDEMLELHFLSSPPPFLQRLYIKGRLEKPPDWIPSLHNLVKLYLSWSRMRDDPLEALEALPNLMKLWLLHAYEGEELCFHAGGFQKLQFLMLDQLEELRLVRVEEGAMPRLQRLCIWSCRLLKVVPLGIECLTNLKELHLSDMSNEFKIMLLSEDYWRVAKIQLVYFYFWENGGWKRDRVHTVSSSI
nr:TPA_asm: hypothetical protein HUJ06_001127 [Nelumbo nucifera]